MHKSDASTPFDDRCPSCGHRFTLVDLKRMAVGDGWLRYVVLKREDGTRELVPFDQFDPVSGEAHQSGERLGLMVKVL